LSEGSRAEPVNQLNSKRLEELAKEFLGRRVKKVQELLLSLNLALPTKKSVRATGPRN
jgi:hypothetical protein